MKKIIKLVAVIICLVLSFACFGCQPNVPPEATYYTVYFYAEDGQTLYDEERVEEGKTVSEPLPPSGAEDFEGWFITGTEDEYDFSTPVTSDVSLYASYSVWGDIDEGING